MIAFWNKGMTTNFPMPGGSLWSAAYAKQSDLYCCFNNDAEAEILIPGCVFCNEKETSWSQLCWAQFFFSEVIRIHFTTMAWQTWKLFFSTPLTTSLTTI
jgi:hypothetical protein